jgi:hypothetical protein
MRSSGYSSAKVDLRRDVLTDLACATSNYQIDRVSTTLGLDRMCGLISGQSD